MSFLGALNVVLFLVLVIFIVIFAVLVIPYAVSRAYPLSISRALSMLTKYSSGV